MEGGLSYLSFFEILDSRLSDKIIEIIARMILKILIT